MSLKRYATRRDKTEPAILQALASVGAKYLLLDAVDVLALYKGRVYLLECKTPKSKKGTVRKTDSQESLVQDGWPVYFVTTGEQALQAIGAIR